jgi:hypothetical protein
MSHLGIGSHWRRSIALLAGVVVPIAVVACLVAVLGARSGPASSTSTNYGRLVQSSADPCGGEGRRVSIAELQNDLPYPVLMPSSNAASSASVSEVWSCSNTGAAISFQSGITLETDVNTFKDPDASLRKFAASDSVETTIGTVQGQTAAIIDPAKDPAGHALGSVTLVERGTWICLVGNGTLSANSLVAIANSLSPVS